MVNIDISMLTTEEQLFSVCRSLIKIFSLSNRPKTIEELHRDYLAVCGNVKKVNEKDPTSSIRSYIGRWNKLARKLGVGTHPKGLDGCKDSGGHRICRKAIPDAGTRAQFYWISDTLWKQLYASTVYTIDAVKTVTFLKSSEGNSKKKRKNLTVNSVTSTAPSPSLDELTPVYAPSYASATVTYNKPYRTDFEIDMDIDSIPMPAPVFSLPDLPTPPVSPNRLEQTTTFEDLSVIDDLFLDDLLWDTSITNGMKEESDSDLDFPESDDDTMQPLYFLDDMLTNVVF